MWEVRPYGFDFAGNIGGFIVRRGAGFTMQIAKTFPLNPWGDSDEASRAADCAIALAITLNRKEPRHD